MFSVKFDTKELDRALPELRNKVQRCMAIGLTRTAGHAQRMIVSAMPRSFDRPTPFTLNGTVVRSATVSRLTARVEAKDWQQKYLVWETAGGQRRLKRFELSLQAVNAMPNGWNAVPAEGVPLDAFGNVSRGLIMKVISQLGTELLSGYTNKSKDAAALARNKARNGTFFAIQPGSKTGMPPGIYQRIETAHGWGSRGIFMFVKKARYHQRLDLDAIGQEASDTYLQSEFTKAFNS